MCRHETATYACGHKEDLGFFCDYAKSYGPLFNKVNCPNYSHGAEKIDHFNQCGKQRGFYCARSQDGAVIDRVNNARETARGQLSTKQAQFQHITLTCSNYLQEAKTRSMPAEELNKNPAYSKFEQQRQLIGRQCTILRNRVIYFNSVLNHALSNRHLLAPGVCHHPEWDFVSFDFAHSVFPPNLLQPILHTLPGQRPPLMAPAGLSADPYPQNTMNQHQNPLPSFNSNVLADPSPAPTVPQVKSAQRPKLKVTITPTKQTTVTEEGSPISSDIIRGDTPEGETPMARAVRYRAQLNETRTQHVTDAMARAGYDVENHGIRPPPARRGNQHTPKKTKSAVTPVANSGPTPKKTSKKTPKKTPKKVRRSTRTRNQKPKYAEGSDNSLGSDPASQDNSNPAWQDSPGKSDAWVETPTRSEVPSWSPEKPTRARNNRTAQRLTGSPNSSPTQPLLSSRIFDYQRRTGYTAREGIIEDTEYHQIAQMPNDLGSNNPHGQDNLVFGGISSNTAYHPGTLQSSHTPQQRTAAMQRSSHLLQECGQSLHQHQVALGMIDTAAADLTQSPLTHHHATSSGMAFAPQAQMVRAMPHPASPQLDGLPNGGSPASPMNFFHHNLNQARAVGAGLPSQGRSFSTGSIQHSAQPVIDSPLSPSNHELHQATPIRRDYENMRRSFSSTANLTPQDTLFSPYPTSGPEPLKRSLPPASPTVSRKRQRLSLPGEDDAPTLTPSQSKHQLYAPAGLPANDQIDFEARIAAIEAFERQNMAGAAALSTAPPNIDPGFYSAQYDGGSAAALAYPNFQADQSVLSAHDNGGSTAALAYPNFQADQSVPIDPQLYKNSSASIVYSTEDSPVDPSAPITEQSGAQPPQAAAASNQGILDDSSSPLSEPDWSLLNDDMF